MSSLDWLFSGDYLNSILDRGYLPHAVIRYGIRQQLAQRIKMISTTSLEDGYASKMKYLDLLRTRPIAINTADANVQHYEVGTGVLKGMLGPRMKYSSCFYPTGREGLAEAEECMLSLYMTRAELQDGMSILDLGCGWGSASLYFAEHLPSSKITAFSNSRTQKEYIDSVAASKGLTNLQVLTGDVVDFDFEPAAYDRVVSIELFEHMKNYRELLAKLAKALKPNGKLFVHIFSHATTPYDFEPGSWMTDHFFSGGTMPSSDLLHFFQDDLRLKQQWWVSGKHYARTCNQWLDTMLRNRKQIWPSLEATYGTDVQAKKQGKEGASVWWQRWQIFYMACAELFDYGGGDTWGVSHYLFEKSGS